MQVIESTVFFSFFGKLYKEIQVMVLQPTKNEVFTKRNRILTKGNRILTTTFDRRKNWTNENWAVTKKMERLQREIWRQRQKYGSPRGDQSSPLPVSLLLFEGAPQKMPGVGAWTVWRSWWSKTHPQWVSNFSATGSWDRLLGKVAVQQFNLLPFFARVSKTNQSTQTWQCKHDV